MGVRKRESADARKEANKSIAFAKLNNCPTSPRKMRLVADLVRGQKVERALNVLRFSSKEASRKLEKLLLSAINNWEQKAEQDGGADEFQLYIKTAHVDPGGIIYRFLPAPQGRAYRVRKRRNHVTIVVENKLALESEA
jgi:large subunit ribosomal protein L22